MFKVPRSQLDAMLQIDENSFVSFIIEHLGQESPELIDGISTETLREMVSNGLARGRSHGLRNSGDLTAFVSVMFEIAPNFDEQPAIRRALGDETIPIDERFDSIFERVPDTAWTEAARDYDPDAWFPELREQSDEDS